MPSKGSKIQILYRNEKQKEKKETKNQDGKIELETQGKEGEKNINLRS